MSFAMRHCIGLLVALLLLPCEVAASDDRLDVRTAQSHLNEIELAVSAGRITQAGSMLQWLERRIPEELQPRLALLLAELHMTKGDSAAAADALANVPAETSDQCRYAGVAGWLAYGHRDWNQAISMLAKSVEACSDDPGRWNLLGLALIQKNETAAALEAFDQALAVAPDNPSLLNNRALAYAYSGKTSAALADLEQAVSMGNDTGIMANLSVMRANTGLEAPLEPSQDPQTQSAILAKAGDGARAADRHDVARAYYAQALLQSELFDKELWARATLQSATPEIISEDRTVTP